MSEDTPLLILLKQMDDFLKSISPMAIQVSRKKVQKFLDIIQNTGASYLQDDFLSPEYLMTLFAPVVEEIIARVMGGLDNFPRVEGVIHTSSEMNYFHPIGFGAYSIVTRAENLYKKSGKTGDYYVFSFRISLINEKEVEVGNDIHQFFLKLWEGVD
jgi:hypothetical protein